MVDEEAEKIARVLVGKAVEGLFLLADVVVGQHPRLRPGLAELFVAEERYDHLVADSADIENEAARPTFLEGSF